jgi:hypothetical protein
MSLGGYIPVNLLKCSTNMATCVTIVGCGVMANVSIPIRSL